MLLAGCLIWSSTVLQAQLLLYQTEPFQFADVGHTAKIVCMSTKTISSGIFFSWYKRRENETSVLVGNCDDNDGNTKFVCRAERRRLILEISSVEREDSGLYVCATKDPDFFSFSNGSSLIVGDSYTPSTRVMLLLPPPHLVHAGQVACVVHGVSNLVQVSWVVPGELQQKGQTLRVKNSSGLLTFVSVLRIPRNPQAGGKNITCEVRFNSSGPGVKETAIFPAPLPTGSDGKCLSYVVPTVVRLLAVLTLLLTFLWIQFCPSRLCKEGICYAQLDFPSGSQDGTGRGNKAPQRDIGGSA